MAQLKRPKTVREMQAEKAKKNGVGQVTIENCSKQLVPIHLNPPKGVDFYIGAQDIRLQPGQVHKFKKNRLRMPQIERLQKQRMIRVIYDSDKQPAKRE